MSNKGVFMRFWDQPGLTEMYHITPLPGKKEGINSGLTSSMNVGIGKYISEEKKEAAIKVIEYLTSEEVQKEIIVKRFGTYTGIKKLYDDEEVCKILICPVVKEAQTIHREFKDVDNFYIDKYIKKVNNIFDEFLFENKSTEEALSEITDISKIYYISLKTSIGISFFIALIFTLCFILFTFSILSRKKYEEKYTFFTLDSWIIYGLGYMIIIFSEFLNYGELSDTKCQLRFSLLFIGIDLCMIPIFYKLLISFPDINKYSQYLLTHKYVFILFVIGIEILLNILLIITPFTKEKKKFENTNINKNFARCTMTNKFGNVITLLNLIIKAVMVLSILLLVFIEWNVKEIHDDVRAIAINEYITNFSLLLLVVLEYIKINNYQVIFVIHSAIIIIICMCNYIFIYSIKILFMSKERRENKINLRSGVSVKASNNLTSTNNNKNKNLVAKIINYHYSEYSILTGSSVNYSNSNSRCYNQSSDNNYNNTSIEKTNSIN